VGANFCRELVGRADVATVSVVVMVAIMEDCSMQEFEQKNISAWKGD